MKWVKFAAAFVIEIALDVQSARQLSQQRPTMTNQQNAFFVPPCLGDEACDRLGLSRPFGALDERHSSPKRQCGQIPLVDDLGTLGHDDPACRSYVLWGNLLEVGDVVVKLVKIVRPRPPPTEPKRSTTCLAVDPWSVRFRRMNDKRAWAGIVMKRAMDGGSVGEAAEQPLLAAGGRYQLVRLNKSL